MRMPKKNILALCVESELCFYVENRQDVFESIESLSSACQFHACAAAPCQPLAENLCSIFRFYSVVWLSSKRNGSTKVCFCHKRYAMQTLNPYRPLCIVFIWKKMFVFSCKSQFKKCFTEAKSFTTRPSDTTVLYVGFTTVRLSW